MFKRILVSTDGSEISHKAEQSAVRAGAAAARQRLTRR